MSQRETNQFQKDLEILIQKLVLPTLTKTKKQREMDLLGLYFLQKLGLGKMIGQL